uniref:EOG090X01LQ n=1 Tax=Alona affinis TaxID=381656 RepID=A0A9N6WSC2_9CRUS|nr:EOG090X01LQ [Alona affinis]
MKNAELYSFLSQYVLLDDQLINLGYPVESAFYPDRAIIYKTPETNVTYYRTDFRGQLETIEIAEQDDHSKPPLSPSLEKRCVRCRKGFFVTLDGEYLTEEKCQYHWGIWKRSEAGYTCCNGPENSSGCASGQLHVWNGVSPGMNGPYDDYVRTGPCQDGQRPRQVYALDTEMLFTGRGLEVGKVSVISIDGCLVYETLVQPERPVVDYNTRFSGLSEADLKRGPSKTVSQVQRDLLGFISNQTILIGHGLENDLRALRILHSRIIDTAVLFPHYFGFPFRRSLKSLVSAYLQRNIQTGQQGHDSFEDARACAELVLWKAAVQLRRNKSEHCFA